MLGTWNVVFLESECDIWNEWFGTWNMKYGMMDAVIGKWNVWFFCNVEWMILFGGLGMWNMEWMICDMECGIWHGGFGICNMKYGMRDLGLWMWNAVEWVIWDSEIWNMEWGIWDWDERDQTLSISCSAGAHGRVGRSFGTVFGTVFVFVSSINIHLALCWLLTRAYIKSVISISNRSFHILILILIRLLRLCIQNGYYNLSSRYKTSVTAVKMTALAHSIITHSKISHISRPKITHSILYIQSPWYFIPYSTFQVPNFGIIQNAKSQIPNPKSVTLLSMSYFCICLSFPTRCGDSSLLALGSAYGLASVQLNHISLFWHCADCLHVHSSSQSQIPNSVFHIPSPKSLSPYSTYIHCYSHGHIHSSRPSSSSLLPYISCHIVNRDA